MQASEFNRIARKTDLAVAAVQMAKAYLVYGGRTYDSVGKEYGVSRQRVHIAVKRILLEARRQEKPPEDWERVVLFLPQAKAKAVRHEMSVWKRKRMGKGG